MSQATIPNGDQLLFALSAIRQRAIEHALDVAPDIIFDKYDSAILREIFEHGNLAAADKLLDELAEITPTTGELPARAVAAQQCFQMFQFGLSVRDFELKPAGYEALNHVLRAIALPSRPTTPKLYTFDKATGRLIPRH